MVESVVVTGLGVVAQNAFRKLEDLGNHCTARRGESTGRRVESARTVPQRLAHRRASGRSLLPRGQW